MSDIVKDLKDLIQLVEDDEISGKIAHEVLGYYLQEDDDNVEFQIMFRDLQKDFISLSQSDRETILLIISAMKNKTEV